MSPEPLYSEHPYPLVPKPYIDPKGPNTELLNAGALGCESLVPGAPVVWYSRWILGLGFRASTVQGLGSLHFREKL